MYTKIKKQQQMDINIRGKGALNICCLPFLTNQSIYLKINWSCYYYIPLYKYHSRVPPTRIM